MNERDVAAGDGTVPPAGGSTGSAVAAMGAVTLGFVCLVVGGAVSGALMFANLKLAPALPLFLPATLFWLWLFWRYLRGDGWPRSTSDWRRDLLRAHALPRACGDGPWLPLGLPSRRSWESLS